MVKKITALIKLALPAGKATPAPPVGPALGQHGVNIAVFCKDYNARTNDKAGLIIPVEISVYEDRSYTFILKTPPASVLLANAARIKKGSSTPNRVNVGSITKAQLEEIATINSSLRNIDFNNNPVTYVQLDVHKTRDQAVREFKMMLREAMPRRHVDRRARRQLSSP